MKVPLASRFHHISDSFVGGKLLLFSVPPPPFLVYSCPCDLTWDASVLEQSALLPFFFFFYHISTTLIFTVCFTSAPSVSWSLVRYTMSRREKKKKMVGLWLFLNKSLRTMCIPCVAVHTPVYCSTHFSVVFQPGQRLCVLLLEVL